MKDQFERHLAELKESKLYPHRVDERGFEYLKHDVFGWRRDEATEQWICYRGGKAFLAVTDETIKSAPSIEDLNKQVLGRGAPPLPRGIKVD